MREWIALGLAGLFGVGYAGMTRRIRRRYRDHGLSPILSAGCVTGVSFCFLLVAEAKTVAWLAGLFVASGLPMAWEYYDYQWQEDEEAAQRVEIDL